MRKIRKSAFALFLAGVMAFTPAADVLAVSNNDTDVAAITVSETEDTVPKTDAAETESETEDNETTTDTTDNTESEEDNADSDTTADPGSDSETETGNDGSTDSDSETNSDANADSEDNNATDSETDADTESEDSTDSGIEDDTDSETEDGLDSEIGDDTDSETEDDLDSEIEDDADSETEDNLDSETEDDADSETEEDLDSETEDDADSETEQEFPGLTNSSLSSKQLSDLKDLADHLGEIAQGKEGTDYVSRELVFSADTLEEAEKIVAAYGGKLIDFDWGIGVLKLPEGISVTHALTTAAKSTDVVLPPAWPNYIYTKLSDTDEDTYNDTETLESEADETYLDENAYSEAIKAFSDPFLSPTSDYYQYQHTMVGSTYAWNAGYTGEGIKIAILDTGVSQHTDLNIVGNYNFSGENAETETAPSGPATDYDDKDGHGTHVAGLAAAKNNTVGGAGIAPDASIYNIRVLNSDGQGTSAWINRGINHAVDQKVDIISMSLGGAGYSDVDAETVKNAYEAGIVVIAAAGNDGSKVKSYPACYPGAICIGAVQQNKGRTYFSNYGSWVDFSAPGSNLYSTASPNSTYKEYVNGAYYEPMSGTSQATPVVSGTAAVILSADEGIRNKTGKARVDALIAKMKKGTIAGNGGAAGIVSLPKALGISVSTAAPSVPVFENTEKTINADSVNVSIKAASPADVIYYSIDGKNPTYKNGVFSSNAIRYTTAFPVGGQSKVTVKAIAVSACGKVSKTASITFTFKPLVSEVVITGPSAVLKGKSITLKATVAPAHAANKKVKWSSSEPDVVKVVGGKVTATSSAVDGKTYTITAASEDGNATSTFNVTVRATAKIKTVAFKDGAGKAKKSDTIIKPAGNTMTYDDLISLTKVTNTDGSEGTIADVDFSSSNTQVARVDNTTRGRLTIVGTGKAVITAIANDGSGKKATFTLTVKNQVTELTIKGSKQLSIGKSIKLTVSVNADAANKTATWSITPAGQGVTINAKNGTVKAAKSATAGSYTVTAVANDGSEVHDTYTIAVSNNTITKITLDKKTATIFRTAGNYGSATSTKVTATIAAPSPSTAAYEFISSNPGIATVDQNGTVRATGNMAGSTKITCKATDGSGKSAACTIKVVNPPSKLTVTPPAGNDGYVGLGKKIKLSAVFEEEFGSVSSKKVTWESNNKDVATVDKNGNVKGVKKGVVDITATANDGSGLETSYKVAVMGVIKKLGLENFKSGYLHIFKPNAAGEVGVLFNGSYYNNTSDVYPFVAVESSNPDVINASWSTEYYGVINLYTRKKGSATITIKALDGSGTKVSYKVKVN